MKGISSNYKRAAIAVAVIMVLCCIIFDPVYTVLLYPVFVIVTSLYYYKASRVFDWRFIGYLILNMLAEIGFMLDFTTYYELAVITTFLAEILLIFMLRPLWRFDLKSVSTHNLSEFIIGFLGVAAVVIYLLIAIFPKLPNVLLFIPTIVSFTILNVMCFSIPVLNKHPRNVYLWGVGGAFIGELLMAFIYEYIQSDKIFIILAHVLGLALKLTLASYLTKIPVEEQISDDYL